VSPVRVYLVASVLYFLIAVVSPNVVDAPRPKATSRGDFNLDLSDPEEPVAQLTPEKRAEILVSIERAPWWMRPVTQPTPSIGLPPPKRHPGDLPESDPMWRLRCTCAMGVRYRTADLAASSHTP
jgi:hypothetical protein